MLSWFDADPSRHWILVCVAMALPLALAGRPLIAGSVTRSSKRPDWLWALAILAVLVAGRWPGFFVTREYNADESQMIAGALTLRHDPVFWRSVDGATGGPFDFYALLPMGWLMGGDGYLSARLTALLLILGTLFLVHEAIARTFGVRVARISTLPLVCFESLTLHPDFLHYSTELVPIFLLALSFFLALPSVVLGQQGTWGRNVWLGIALGAVPFAKLQAGPIAAVAGFSILLLESRRHVQERTGTKFALLALAAGAMLPLGSIAVMLTVTAQWQHAVTPYILANVSYLGTGLPTIGASLTDFSVNLDKPGTLFGLWLASCLLFSVPGFFLHAEVPAAAKRFALIAGIFLLISMACVLFPRRPFPHYLQLLVVPSTLVVGSSLGIAVSSKKRFAHQEIILLCTALIGGTGLPLLARSRVNHPDVGRLLNYQAAPLEKVALAIRRYAERGESMAFWGWHCRYYAETGLWHATRDAYPIAEIIKNDYADYYHRRYLEDFTRNLPPVFVDESDIPRGLPASVLHETFFPALGRLVQVHYTLAETINKTRIFVRNDRLARARPAAEK